MKKKLGEILKVSNIFKTLTTKHYNNFSLAYKIAKASKSLEEQTAFYIDQERQLIETYAEKDKNGQVKIIDGNRISFKDQESAMNFNKEINSLQQTEVEIFDVFDIHLNDFREGEMDLTPADILSLEGFVNFIDDVRPEVVN